MSERMTATELLCRLADDFHDDIDSDDPPETWDFDSDRGQIDVTYQSGVRLRVVVTELSS